MRSARNALATAVLNGRVYAFGGSTEAFGNPASTVESWAEGESRWRAEASMPHQRMRHAAVALGGRLYVLGGHDGERALDSVLSYDPEIRVRLTNQTMARREYCRQTNMHISTNQVHASFHEQ